VKRVFCDGHYHRGEMKELLEPNFAKVRLSDETATVLDLCFECMPHYEQFAAKMDNMTLASARAFRRQTEEEERRFWAAVKDDGKKESGQQTQHTTRVG